MPTRSAGAATKPRTVEVFAPGGSLADTEWDGHIRAIIRVNRDILTRSATTGLWRDSSETALFVSDVVLPAAQCAKAIRDHWHIEKQFTLRYVAVGRSSRSLPLLSGGVCRNGLGM